MLALRLSPVAALLVLSSLLIFQGGDDKKGGKKDDKDKDKVKEEPKPLVEYHYNAKGWVTFNAILEGKTKLLTYSETNKATKELTVTNILVIRIDGTDHVFGVGPGGKWVKEKAELGNGGDGKKRLGHRHIWETGDIELTQTVEIVPGKGGKLDACLVRYGLENKGSKEHKIGLRKMIDTFMVETDNHPFALPGQRRLIRNQADFKDEAVPDVVLALQNADIKKPGLIAVYTLNPGKGMLPPDRVAMTRFARDEKEAFQFDYQVRDIDEDAALVLWWNPRILGAGERVDVGYAVGLSEVDLDAKK